MIPDASNARVLLGESGANAPVIYVVDSPEHPFDVAPLAYGRRATLASVPVASWNDALTPWPALGIYREEAPFGGQAAQTLASLVEEAIPAIEAQAELAPTTRAICGYSLGGLFSLYALTHSDAFAACACLSGSLWYEGWAEHLANLDINLTGRFAYLSLGTKERKAARPILKTVQDQTEQCVTILQRKGCQVEYRTGPGNHMQHIPERFDAGLSALDAFLTPREA